jgi:predicted lysophospholipase L1 biosynthesis ABC-type transport system permease subunit
MHAESGLNKIKSALGAGNAATVFAGGAAFATLLLSAVFIVLLAHGYLTENERSLCVMRAFGLTSWQTIWLTSFQLFVIFLFAFVVLAVLLLLGWPHAAAWLASAVELEPEALYFHGTELALVGFGFLFVLAVSSTIVVLLWRRRTKWIAERLQQVG